MYAVSVAQNDYKEGFIISQKDDTTNGFLLFNNNNIFTKCLFKPSKDSNVIKYNSDEIKGFRFNNGKYYVSKIVLLDEKPEQRFLEYLIQGKSNIYYLRERTDHYYIETDSSNLIELSEKEVLYGSSYVRPSWYKGKLRAVLSLADDMDKEIENTRLTHKSLIRLAKSYHYKVCDTEDCIIFEKNESNIEIKLAAIIGYTYNKFLFGVNAGSDYRQGKNIGLKIKVLNVFSWSERTTLFTGLIGQHYSSYGLSKNGTDKVYVDYNKNSYDIGGRGNTSIIGIETLEVDINVWSIKIPLGIS
jgi:hypothetical protein